MSIPLGFVALRTGPDFMGANGPLYVREDGARLHVGFRVEQRHCNRAGICHGGMLATYVDMLMPVTIRRHPEVGVRFVPTVSLQIDYLAPAVLGAWVQGEAQVLRVTRSLVFAQGLASADGQPCVRASGVFKIGPPFEDAPAP